SDVPVNDRRRRSKQQINNRRHRNRRQRDRLCPRHAGPKTKLSRAVECQAVAHARRVAVTRPEAARIPVVAVSVVEPNCGGARVPLVNRPCACIPITLTRPAPSCAEAKYPLLKFHETRALCCQLNPISVLNSLLPLAYGCSVGLEDRFAFAIEVPDD